MTGAIYRSAHPQGYEGVGLSHLRKEEDRDIVLAGMSSKDFSGQQRLCESLVV